MAHNIKFYAWDGVPTPIEDRKRWAVEIVEKLERQQSGNGAYSLSGEGMVAGFRLGDTIHLFDVIIQHRAEIRIGAPSVSFPDDEQED
jgi:hypothetical protein